MEPVHQHFQSGLQNLADGDVSAAKGDFLQVIELDPHCIQAYCYISAIFAEQDDCAAAVKMAKQGLAVDPDHPSLTHADLLAGVGEAGDLLFQARKDI